MAQARNSERAVPSAAEIIEGVLRERYHQRVQPLHEPALSGEVRPDFLGILSDGTLILVEALRRPATVHDVVHLVGLGIIVGASAQLRADHDGEPGSGRTAGRGRIPKPNLKGRKFLQPAELLLLAPAFSQEAQRVAKDGGVTLQVVEGLAIVPARRDDRSQPTRFPLTSETTWRALALLIQRREFPTIQAWSKAAGISYGWTHSLTSYLLSLNIVRATDRRIELENLSQLLDFVGMERPLRHLRVFEIPVSAEVSAATVLRGVKEVFPEMGEPLLCGLSAASARGSRLEFPGTLQVYADVPEGLRNAFAHSPAIRDLGKRLGEIHRITTAARRVPEPRIGTLEVFYPDRDVREGSTKMPEVRVVSLEQTLLDCAGAGSAGRRALTQLVNMRADGP